MTNPSESHLLEELSDLEHRQWLHWTRTIIERLEGYDKQDMPLHTAIATTKQRWEPNWKPYDKLSWETKEFNREWSRQVLGIIRKYLQ